MAVKPRAFYLPDGTRLPDPDPTKTPAEVRDYYGGQYPAITNATYEFSREGGRDVYKFKSSAGTKG